MHKLIKTDYFFCPTQKLLCNDNRANEFLDTLIFCACLLLCYIMYSLAHVCSLHVFTSAAGNPVRKPHSNLSNPVSWNTRGKIGHDKKVKITSLALKPTYMPCKLSQVLAPSAPLLCHYCLSK